MEIERTIETKDDIKEALEGFNKDCWAFDVETRREDTKQLSTDWFKHEVFTLSLYDGEISVLVDCYDAETRDELLTTVFDYIAPNQGKNTKVIAHNIVYDIKALRKHGVSLYNADWFDTMIAHHLLDERKRHGLKPLAEEYLDANTFELSTAYDSDEMCPMFARYARNDTIWTYELAEEFWPKVKKQGLKPLFKKVEMPFQRAIVEMETNGVQFNRELAEEYRKKLQDAINNMKIEMCEMLDINYEIQSQLTDGVTVEPEINFASNAQIRKLLYEELGLEAEVETDAGNPSTGEAALKALKDEHPIIEPLLEFRSANQYLTNFFDVLPDLVDDDGRIRPSYLDHTTVTGRLSSREPNMQNQPSSGWKGLHPRECFEASDGKKMIAIDYDGQELRIASQVTKDENLIQDIKDGLDPHLKNANTVFDLGLSREEMMKDHKDYAKTKKKYKESGERGKAKIFTYGILYGATEYRIMQEFECSEEQATKYLEDYFDEYPGLKRKFDEVEKTVDKQGFVSSMYGRRRRFDKRDGKYGEYYPPSAYRQAKNFCVGGDTYIWTKNKGLKKIKETRGETTLWDGKQWVDGDIVKTGEKALYRVWFNNGQHIDVTEDHKLLAVNNSGKEFWKTIEDFNKNQWVRNNDNIINCESSVSLPSPDLKEYQLQSWQKEKKAHNAKKASFEDIDDNYSIGLILGCIASDGGFHGDAVSIYIGEHEYDETYEDITSRIPWGFKEKQNGKTTKLTIYSITLARQLEWLNIKNEVHPYITSSQERLRGYLRGYFDGDGGVQVGKETKEFGKTSSIHLCGGQRHNNTELFEQIQQCLLAFGIRSRLRKYDESVRLFVMHKHNGRFKREIGFINQNKQEKIIVRERDTELGPVEKIDKVEHIGEKTVYDVVETDTHRFLANGFVAHNCIQGAGADMMRVAMVKLMNYKHNNPEYGINLLMTVHDEVVLECDEEYAETVCKECSELVASVVGDKFVVPMPAEGDIGDNYAEAK